MLDLITVKSYEIRKPVGKWEVTFFLPLGRFLNLITNWRAFAHNPRPFFLSQYDRTTLWNVLFGKYKAVLGLELRDLNTFQNQSSKNFKGIKSVISHKKGTWIYLAHPHIAAFFLADKVLQLWFLYSGNGSRCTTHFLLGNVVEKKIIQMLRNVPRMR